MTLATDANIYISGPMRGIAEFNFPAFHKAEAALNAMGYGGIDAEAPMGWNIRRIFNPALRDEEAGLDVTGMTGDLAEIEGEFDLRIALSTDLKFITEQADAIVVLNGWENSSGARAEVAAAQAIGIPVYRIWMPYVDTAKYGSNARLVHLTPRLDVVYPELDAGGWPFSEEMGEASAPLFKQEIGQGRIEDHTDMITIGGAA